MRTSTFITRLTTAAAIALTLATTGCAGDDANEIAATQPSVDPRFADVDSFLQHYNSLATREPVNMLTVLDLFYAETPFQRRYIDVTRRMAPIGDLDWLMFETFNKGWSPTAKKPLLSADGSATIVERGDERARAKYVDHRNKTRDLQLVRIGGRWWASGYTMEHDPENKTFLREIDLYEKLIPAWAACVPEVMAQVRSGQITTAEKARAAVVLLALERDPSLGPVLGQWAQSN